MSKEIIDGSADSRPDWEHLEDWLRGQGQGMIQELLEQEVTEPLGRVQSARRSYATPALPERDAPREGRAPKHVFAALIDGGAKPAPLTPTTGTST